MKSKHRGPGGSVDIATDYGLDGPGIESRWGEIFRLSRPALGPTHPPVQWVPGLSWGVTLTPHPLLVPWSWKDRAIPLLPLWAVWPVQSHSACTMVTFTFTFTLQEHNYGLTAELTVVLKCIYFHVRNIRKQKNCHVLYLVPFNLQYLQLCYHLPHKYPEWSPVSLVNILRARKRVVFRFAAG